MRKRISNEKASELAKQGKAEYAEGGKPEAIESVQDTFMKVQATIKDMTKKMDSKASSGNEAILDAVDVVIESMNLYHEAVMMTLGAMPKDKGSSLDSKKLDMIGDRILAVLTAINERPPKEWEFDVVYDWKNDKPEKIMAKEVKH